MKSYTSSLFYIKLLESLEKKKNKIWILHSFIEVFYFILKM